MNRHQNVIQFSKIQNPIIQINVIFGEFRKQIVYIIESNLRIIFKIFHLDKHQ
jgi:hypothetical protein